MKKYTTKQLEVAFEFCRIVNERGGFRLSAEAGGVEEDIFFNFPTLTTLLNSPDDCEHLPLPPKKVMMQMFRYGDSLTLHGVSASLSDHYNYDRSSWEKIGEPFEFVFPEEVK